MLRKDIRDFFDMNQTRGNEKWNCERREFFEMYEMGKGNMCECRRANASRHKERMRVESEIRCDDERSRNRLLMQTS